MSNLSNSPKEAQGASRPKWVLFRSCVYLKNKGLHFGSAPGRIYEKRAYDLNKYCIGVDPRKGGDSDVCTDSLSFAKDREYDWIFLDTIFAEHPRKREFLKEAKAKLAPGGHLLILVKGSLEGGLLADLEAVSGWKEKDLVSRDGFTLAIYKHLPGGKGITKASKPANARACIVRYGAFGDQIMITPLIKALHNDGYLVTVNISSGAAMVLEENPYVDNMILQERDVIFNPELGQYWAEWAGEYDKYINLSESIEGNLLKVEGRKDFYTSNEFRRKVGNTNYYEYTMALGGYPDVIKPKGELFFSSKEEKLITKGWDDLKDKFKIVWVLKGSSYHKSYPLSEALLCQWLADKPDAMVFTVGGPDAKDYDIEHPQVLSTLGRWNIRQSMLATKHADLVVGPETGVMNAAGCFDTPKVVMLSHSSEENLCSTWNNYIPLKPNLAVAPCYPCHQMHYNMESCPLAEIVDDKTEEVIARGPVCSMGAISIDTVREALNTVYFDWKGAKIRS